MAGYVGETQLEWPDMLVIVAYFVFVIAVGLWASMKNRGSVGGYFLAGRNMHFVLVGASLFASNIGSGHFIGLAGSGAASGIGISVFELNAIFVLMILGWIFVPVYVASGVFTMPEYLRMRFGGQRIRVYLALLAIVLSIFTKVAADLYAGAVFIEQALGWNIYLAIILLLAVAALFTITGGLTAVIWTDFIQTIIMLIGASYLMIASFAKTNGFEGVRHLYPRSATKNIVDDTRYGNSTGCGIPTSKAFNFMRPIDDGDLPWFGVVFGALISSLWYWCSDQVIVQRTLAAKDLSHAKGGCIVAGYLKILPMWLIVLPGMISRILYTDEVGCSDPAVCKSVCDIEGGCTNIAYPLLVLRIMPVGARGLMLSVMLSALMSSLTSIFNSSSTIFTIDIWIRLRNKASDTELMIVGRVFVLCMVAVGIAWIPIVKNFSELFVYIQSVTSFLAPPICAVYCLAVGWKRTNEKGAFWGLMVGLVVGLTRFIWESALGAAPPCGQEDTRPAIIKDVHYLHFGILLCGITAIVTVVVSLVTKPIPEEYLTRLTFFDRFNEGERRDIAELTPQKKKEGTENPAFTDSMDTGLDVQEPEADEDDEKKPCYKNAWNWVCGIEKPMKPLTPEQKAEMDKLQTSLEEVPLHRKICNINAIILLTLATFIWGFFA